MEADQACILILGKKTMKKEKKKGGEKKEVAA